MPLRRVIAAGAALSGVVAVLVLVGPTGSGGASPVPGATGCAMFPATSIWAADVRGAPVHPSSASWVSRIGATAGLKADFGEGLWDGGPIGIPYTTVAGTQPRVPVTFQWPAESDPGPYPIPTNAPIEGGAASSGDRHVLVVDRDRCELWETFDSHPQGGGASWTAGSGAHWTLASNTMRTSGWTSADAAGLPILPFLVRYDEIVAGVIDHPLRFTVPRTANAFVWPASHKAGTGASADPPMGSWFRLRADFDISGFSPTNQIILRALKEHGMVLADNGSSWYTSGVPDDRWDNDDLNDLRTVPGSAFEAIDMAGYRVSPTSYELRPSTPPTSTTTTTVPPVGGNGGFETGTAGWTPGTGTALDRGLGGHSGQWAGRLTRTGTSRTALIDDAPDWVPVTQARTYTGGVWVQGPSGRTARLLLVEHRSDGTTRTKTVTVVLDGAWQHVTTAIATKAGSQLGVQLEGRGLSLGQQLLVDDVTLA